MRCAPRSTASRSRASGRCRRASFRRGSAGASGSRGSRCCRGRCGSSTSRRPRSTHRAPSSSRASWRAIWRAAASSSPRRTHRSGFQRSARGRSRSRDRTMITAAATMTPAATDAVWPAIRWAVARDLKLALRSRTELAVQLLFYVIVVSLFPLATSPEKNLLSTMGPGVLWVAALLASLLSLPRLFAADYVDGTLEQIVLSPFPLVALVFGKIVAHWLTTGLPIVVLAPLLG